MAPRKSGAPARGRGSRNVPTSSRIAEGPLKRTAAKQAVSAAKTAEGIGRDRIRKLREGEATTSSWAPVDLGVVLEGGELEAAPTLLARTDDACLIYAGKVHSFAGEPESGKDWLMLFASAERLALGEHAVYIDFEGEATTAVERLRALAAADEAIRERFHYLRPDEPLNAAAWEELDQVLAHEPSLVVISGMTDALAIHDIDLRDNTEIAKWLRALPRKLAQIGPAVALIDHVTKSREDRGRWQIGGQHKLAGIDVSHGLRARQPLGRGMTGEVLVTVEKDRPGHVP